MDSSTVNETKNNNDTNNDCVKRSISSYEAELATYDDLWKEIRIKDKISVNTPEQMTRYKKYITLLKEYISLYD